MSNPLKPAVQPSNVTNAGAISEILVPPGFRTFPIARVIVAESDETPTEFNVDLSTDPLFLDPLQVIAELRNASTSNEIDVMPRRPYSWDALASNGRIYVRITPTTPGPHNFLIQLYQEVRGASGV